jgi:hypothetical protein
VPSDSKGVVALIRHLVVRALASRLSVACVALVFGTTGSARVMDAHAMSSHASHHASQSHHIIAVAATDVAASQAADPHAGHHMGSTAHDADEPADGEEQSSAECTCVGPCQGGTPPPVSRQVEYTIAAAEVGFEPPVARTVLFVRRDPTSHLLPLPNAPPARV